MAVRLPDYFPHHVHRILAATSLVLLCEILVLYALLSAYKLSATTLISLLAIIVIIQGVSFFVVLRMALKPLSIITRAVTQISGQPHNVTPPNVNVPEHVKSGLRDVVQTIYDANMTTGGSSHQSTDMADILPCGVIGLDDMQHIVYHNRYAPVTATASGDKALTLQFNPDSSLEKWIKKAVESKVTDINIWTSIPDADPERSERKIYDVIVVYEKNAQSGIETRIVTIDRTASYLENQEDIDFISVAAHELRGPITVIRGYLDVIIHELQPKLNADQNALLERLDVSASRLAGYVNNILNVSKFDRKHLQLHLKEDTLVAVVSSVADDLILRAKTNQRLLSFQIPDGLPTIAVDRNSLTEVISNLIDNAIKYSHDGGQILVTASVDGNYVRCSVQDNGIGIPPSVAEHLFEKFYRSHRTKNSISGTGIGLYISRAIIESHGGKIGASSTEGEGSTFTFSVPVYKTVADKLTSGHNGNQGIIRSSSGWIKNHSKIGG